MIAEKRKLFFFFLSHLLHLILQTSKTSTDKISM